MLLLGLVSALHISATRGLGQEGVLDGQQLPFLVALYTDTRKALKKASVRIGHFIDPVPFSFLFYLS